MTNRYNEALKAHLPESSIQVREIPRFERNGTPVSASAVRGALAANDWDTIRTLVPKTTFDHLQTIKQEV